MSSEDEFQDCVDGEDHQFQDANDTEEPQPINSDQEQSNSPGKGEHTHYNVEDPDTETKEREAVISTTNDLNMMDTPDEKDVKENPYIMSFTVAVGKKSFIDSRQEYVHLAPPPKYFTDQYLMATFGSLPNDR